MKLEQKKAYEILLYRCLCTHLMSIADRNSLFYQLEWHGPHSTNVARLIQANKMLVS